MHSLHSPSHPASLRIITQSHFRTSYFPPQSPTPSALRRSSSPASARSPQILAAQPGSPLVSCLKPRTAHSATSHEGGYVVPHDTSSHDLPGLAHLQYQHRPSVSTYDAYHVGDPQSYTHTHSQNPTYFNDDYALKTDAPVASDRPAVRRVSSSIKASAIPLSPSAKYTPLSPMTDKPAPLKQFELSDPTLDPRRASHPPLATVAAIAEGARRRPSFKIGLPPRPTPVDILITEGSTAGSTPFIVSSPGQRHDSLKATHQPTASTYTSSPAPGLYYLDPANAPIFVEPFAQPTHPAQCHPRGQGDQEYIILHPDLPSPSVDQVGPKGEHLHAHQGSLDRSDAAHVLDVQEAKWEDEREAEWASMGIVGLGYSLNRMRAPTPWIRGKGEGEEWLSGREVEELGAREGMSRLAVA